ncbi:NAD dependent epimerase/dehydratase family protein [Pleurostoma richardsiae]|uniref:NAD dependent epimerase/dehydratase family protein n=1 Tax=Pleurostoma richardsiae TaxID=41990 RepID=A0AA38S473_9PEZI|nr:NAD dependent epimerase/dehydratase family protein [Pleurostoma richardsiae]
MRVFVTGATGFIGQPLVKDLLKAGHSVLGLARSDVSAKTLIGLGADVVRGSIEDLDTLKKAAAASDGVIHLAFIHDFSDYDGSCRKDREAISAIGAALEGSNRPFVIASGTFMLPPGRLGTEDDPADMSNAFTTTRSASEVLVLSLASKGVLPSVVRLPPTNHGDSDPAFIAMIVSVAQKTGVSAYIGEGLNHWPAAHRLDSARVFRLALEKGAAGAVYHAVAEEGVLTKDIAAAIGKGLGIPLVSKSSAEASEHFGFIAIPFAIDNLASSSKTRKQLGWVPEQSGLIEDIESGVYFKK